MTDTSRPSSSAGTPPGPTRPGRRPRLGWWLLLGLVIIPVAEIVVMVLVGRAIGLWWTLTLIVGLAVVGTWLAKRETGRTYRALQKAVDSGRLPADEMTDGILLLVGGVLLLLPGFITDVFALLLVLPFTRPLARRLLQALVASRVLVAAERAGTVGGGRSGPQPFGRAGRSGEVIDGEVVADEPPPGREPGPSGAPLER